jgi:hypothetical protein
MIEAEHMVKVLAIEGFLLTCYRRKTLFKSIFVSFETSCFLNVFSALRAKNIILEFILDHLI